MKLITALLFVLFATFQIVAQTVLDAEIFESVMPSLKEKTSVPVMLPIYLAVEDEVFPLYAIVEEATPTRYELELAFTPDCGGANVCHYGIVSGQVITEKTKPLRGKAVELAQGLKGYFQDAKCKTTCTDSTMSWDQKGFRYTVGIKAGNEETLRKVANSFTNNAYLFTKNSWKRTCFLDVYVEKQDSGTGITDADVTAINRENKKTYQSKLVRDVPSFLRLPEGQYEIIVSGRGYGRALQVYQVKCSADDRELEITMRVKSRGKGETQ